MVLVIVNLPALENPVQLMEKPFRLQNSTRSLNRCQIPNNGLFSPCFGNLFPMMSGKASSDLQKPCATICDERSGEVGRERRVWTWRYPLCLMPPSQETNAGWFRDGRLKPNAPRHSLGRSAFSGDYRQMGFSGLLSGGSSSRDLSTAAAGNANLAFAHAEPGSS